MPFPFLGKGNLLNLLIIKYLTHFPFPIFGKGIVLERLLLLFCHAFMLLLDKKIAKSRGYDLHELIRLTNFVVELMQMSPELESQFDEQVIQPKTRKDTDMEKLSPYEKRFINQVFEGLYGESAEAMVAEIKSAKNEVKAVKSELKAAKVTQTKAIVVFYTKAAMSIEEIAEELSLTKAQVRKVLRAHQLIE